MSGRKIFAWSLNKTSSVDLKQQPHFHFPINRLLVAIPRINFMFRTNLWRTFFRRLRSSPLTSEDDSIFELCAKAAVLNSPSPFSPQKLRTFSPFQSFPSLKADRTVLLPASALRFMSSITVSGDFVDFFFFLFRQPYWILSPLPNSVILWPGE